VGIGVTPSAWNTYKAVEIGGLGSGFFGVGGSQAGISQGAYYATGWKYAYTSVAASEYLQIGAEHRWYNAPSGTAGNAITFTQAMTLNASGFLGIGQTNPVSFIDVYGNGAYTSARFWRSDEAGYGGRVGSGNTLLGAAAARSLGLDGFAGISFGIAGSQVATFDSSGRLGIGITSPTRLLDMTAATAVSYLVSSTGTNTSYYGATNTGGAIYVGRENSVGGTFGTTAYSSVVWSEGAYPLVFATNNAEKMRIDSSGNVSIGTTTSSGKFTILDNSGGAGVALPIVVTNGVDANFYLGLTGSTATDKRAYIGPSTATALAFQTNATERMRIDSSGNVGIGTTSPSGSKLYINGSSKTYGIASFDGATYAAQDFMVAGTHKGYVATANAVIGGGSANDLAVDASSGNLIFATGDVERMRIDSSGKVGIGTTSPASKLSIAGTTAGSVPYITFTSAFATASYVGVSTQANDIVTGDALGDLVFDSGSNILVTTNGNNLRLKIDTSGNLQIPTGAVMPYAPAPTGIAAATTLTNANIQGQIISATGTTYTITMPLGTTMETLATWAATNIAYDFYVINTASGTVTMAVNTGVTSLGTLTIATGVSAHFRIRRTAANTFVLYRLS
jgi:hypothetical protein